MLFVSHTHHLYPLTLLIVPLLPQPSVPVSGMRINCGNEGHPEELLESSSVSTTDLVGKLLPVGNLTRPQKNTICSSPTSSPLSQQASLTSQPQAAPPWNFRCTL